MATADPIEVPEEQEQEHPGGGRFNRVLGIVFIVVAMAGGVAIALGVQRSGTASDAAVQKALGDPGAAARDRGEVEDLAAHGAEPHSAPTYVATPAVITNTQIPAQPRAPRPPSRYTQWAADKYMKALEAPEMVAAFHGGQTLEIASAKGQPGGSFDFEFFDRSVRDASPARVAIHRHDGKRNSGGAG